MNSQTVHVEDKSHFTVGGVKFRQLQAGDTNRSTTKQEILILKPPTFLKQYDRVFQNLPSNNVVEVGIAEGGSLIYFALMYPKLKFVGIDLRRPNPDVQWQIDRLGLTDRIKLHYGVDQTNGAKLKEIVARAFCDEPVGAVIDDASHFYEHSRKTFETLYSKVTPGGFYCLEDWAWAHEPGRTQTGDLWPDKVSMANLLFQIILLQPSQRDLVRDIHVTKNVAFIERGAKEIGDMDLDALILNRGVPLNLV